MTKKLMLFRHGETEWNRRRDDFTYDEEKTHNIYLNDTGVQQVQQLADTLIGKGIEYVYASSLKRGYQSGKIVAEKLNVSVEVFDGLEEFSTYDETCNGLTVTEIKERIGREKLKERKENRDAWLDWKPLNCETKREARERIYNTIMKICKTTPYDIVAIATHGNAMKEFLRALDYEDDSSPKNCEIIDVEYKDGELEIIQRWGGI